MEFQVLSRRLGPAASRQLPLLVIAELLAAALAGCEGNVVGGGEAMSGDAAAVVADARADTLPEADASEADALEADALEADSPEADAPEADASESDSPEADAPEEPGQDAEQEPHACPQGLVDCAGTCVNPQSDVHHCGAADGCAGANAGTACEAGQSCIAGTCACKPGLVQCPAGCVDVGIDDKNCGSCGSVCGVGTHCTGGACLSCSDVPLLPGLPGIGAQQIYNAALGDVDHDGRIDLAHVENHTLRVALGRGNGTFGEAAEYPLAEAQSVSLADVDADGWLDFVVKAPGATWAVVGSVLVVPNVAGIPGAPVSYPTAKAADQELVVSDLNADGMPEIVIGGAEPTGVRVLMNQGDGTFAAPLTYPTAGIPSSIATGDLDGDGRPDLVEAAADGVHGGVGVLLNLGDGTFGPVSQNGTQMVGHVLIRDLDGHAPSELLEGISNIAVCRLVGGALSCPETYAVGLNRELQPEDVDRDGDVDLIAAGDGSLTVLLNSGDGTFGSSSVYLTYFDTPLSLNAADLTGDGYAEIVVGEHFGLKLVLNRGDGSFVGQREGVGTGVRTDILALADLDLDGSTDLVIGEYGSYGSGGLRVALNDGSGNFGSPFAYPAEIGSTLGIAVGDLNADGLPDTVTTGNDAVRVFINEGGGIFSAGVDWPTSPSPVAVAVGDLNGDAVADIVTGDIGQTWSGTTSILFGLGGATYSAPVGYPGPVWEVAPVIADVNLDGAPDLIIGSQVNGDVRVRLNAGDGTFSAQSTYHAACFGWTIVVADFNGDGAPDMALPGCSDGGVAVLWNDGQGAFPSTEIIPGGADEKFIQAAAGDLNGDGLTDIVLGYPYGNSIGALLNLGGGSFTKTIFYPIGRRPWGPAVADIDGDGRMDILAPMSDQQGVRILLNKGFACSAP